MVSDTPVSAGNVIYEASVVMGEIGWAFLDCIPGGKEICREDFLFSPCKH